MLYIKKSAEIAKCLFWGMFAACFANLLVKKSAKNGECVSGTDK